MRYRCEILNHGIDGYEVWLHGRNQGRSGVKCYDIYILLEIIILQRIAKAEGNLSIVNILN